MTWYMTRGSKPTKRLVIEVTKMRALFNPEEDRRFEDVPHWDVPFLVQTLSVPEFTYIGLDNPEWNIEFRMRNLEKGNFNPKDTFRMKIRYPSTYPSDEPKVTLPSHSEAVRSSPHRFGGGVLCLHDHRNARTGWDPAKSTAATFALWSIQWIRTYYYWRDSGIWPDRT